MSRVEQGTKFGHPRRNPESRQARKVGSGLDKDFWSYVKEHNLLPQLVEEGKITEEQVEVLRRFFEGKGLKKKRQKPTELIDSLSIIVARHVVGLE